MFIGYVIFQITVVTIHGTSNAVSQTKLLCFYIITCLLLLLLLLLLL